MGMRNTKQAIRQNHGSIAMVAIIAGILFIQPINVWLSDQRWWRDITGQTPFYAVVVTSTDITPEGLRLSGEMRKRRCEFDGLSAYVLVDGTRYRTSLDTSPEDAERPGGNRPPAAGPQAWGPWLIKWVGRHPESWSIWVRHQCPGERVPQENLFAKGEWE